MTNDTAQAADEFTIELDTVVLLPGEGGSGGENGDDTIDWASWEQTVNALGVSAAVAVESGPGSSLPVVRYTGTYDALAAMLNEHFGAGDSSGEPVEFYLGERPTA